MKYELYGDLNIIYPQLPKGTTGFRDAWMNQANADSTGSILEPLPTVLPNHPNPKAESRRSLSIRYPRSLSSVFVGPLK